MFDRVESVLPCPHDPASLEHLYLEGQNKLELEVQAARKSSHLVILNPSHSNFKFSSDVDQNTCLIEQGSDEENMEDEVIVSSKAAKY